MALLAPSKCIFLVNTMLSGLPCLSMQSCIVRNRRCHECIFVLILGISIYVLQNTHVFCIVEKIPCIIEKLQGFLHRMLFDGTIIHLFNGFLKFCLRSQVLIKKYDLFNNNEKQKYSFACNCILYDSIVLPGKNQKLSIAKVKSIMLNFHLN